MLWTNVKVRDYFHITRKYRGSGHRVCNINVKLNWKIPIVFNNLKNNDSHLIMQELVKFSLKTKVIPNGLVKGFSFNACINDSYLELKQTTLYPLTICDPFIGDPCIRGAFRVLPCTHY